MAEAAKWRSSLPFVTSRCPVWVDQLAWTGVPSDSEQEAGWTR